MNTPTRALRFAGASSLVFVLSGCSVLSWVGVGGDEPEPPSARMVEGPAATAGRPLAPGDRIVVTSWREDGVSDTLTVDEGGAVVLPLLGRRTVTDQPSDRLKTELIADYEAKFRNHTVGVMLLRRVSVLGAVQQPGIYYVDQTMAVADALALAGGPAEDGKRDEVYLQRAGEDRRIPIARQALLQSYAGSGDQIVVPQRNWFSRNAIFLVGTTVSAAAILLTRVF